METEIITAIIAMVFLACGLLYLEKAKRLKAKGVAVQSIIIKNNYKAFGLDRTGDYYPVVKFQTTNNEWITQELNICQNRPMKEGAVINILYNPENPQEVHINSAMHLTYLPWLLTILGVVVLAFFCLELFEITNVL